MTERATSDLARNARREQILAAAAELFDRIGYEQTTASLIAERAGLAKGSLYTYFPSREAIFVQLLEQELDAWLSELEAGLARDERRLADPLLQLVGELVDALAAAPRLPALAALLRPVLERGLDRGRLQASRERQRGRMRQAALLLSDGNWCRDSEAGLLALSRFVGLIVAARHVVAGGPAGQAANGLATDEPAMLEELENTAYLLFSVSQGLAPAVTA